ncbi:hypothetical protein Vadar_015113 [Vaccinium darrowii]|uniref:Uncharacterized protein n=1 Tax=Vaccinium darrowii TaxID=229202 RepID=A0ACB7XS25_9ERIC|nr:hypothetical protein Vadar_015113 [Vaccinium darrowii]
MADEVVEKLGNVHLTDDEDEDIVIDDGIVQEAVESCRFSFLGKLLTTKRYNTQAMKDSFRRAWGFPTLVRIIDVDANHFHFRFESEDQFVEVQIWGLPVGFTTPIIGETIGKRIGEVLSVDNKAIAADQGKFISVRVRLSLDKPLKPSGNVVLGSGNKPWLDYKYERLNNICFYCGFIGHEMNGCLSKEEDERSERTRPNKFGEEIKLSWNGEAKRDWGRGGGGNIREQATQSPIHRCGVGDP